MPAVVVLSTLGAPVDPALDELLGDVAANALRRELARRARSWAAEVAGPGGLAFEANSAGAALAALEGHEGPVLLVSPDVPGLDAQLAAAALEDLAEGAIVSFAPATDAHPYLIAMPSLDAELVGLAGGSRQAMFDAIAARGGSAGMLRSERRLVSPGDARAFAADPATPLEIGILLAAGLDVRARL